MADDVIILTNGWTQIRREAGVSVRRPVIRVRQSGDLALSVDFVRHARIAECTRANVFVSADGYRLGLRFHSELEDHDSFQLCKDGGSGLKNPKNDARVLQLSGIKSKSATYAKLTGAAQAERTFEPQKDVHGMWVVELRPCFEHTHRGMRGELSSSESGIYRYLLSGETVYIGRANLLERMREPHRQEWDFDEVQYSVINNAEAEAKWEAYWLSRFSDHYNRLPVYNRIAGRRDPAARKDVQVG